MANEPALGSYIIAGVAPDRDANGEYQPKRVVTDDSYDPPRLLVHALGTTNLGLDSVYSVNRAYNGNLLEYEGFAAPGSSAGATVWAIRKFGYTGNLNTSVTWASGNTAFNKEWDERASYTYS